MKHGVNLIPILHVELQVRQGIRRQVAGGLSHSGADAVAAGEPYKRAAHHLGCLVAAKTCPVKEEGDGGWVC